MWGIISKGISTIFLNSSKSSRKDSPRRATEENCASVATLPRNSIASIGSTQLRHKICNVDSASEADSLNHVDANRNAVAEKKYCLDDIVVHTEHTGNVNLPCISIVLTGSNQFYCKICSTSCVSEADLRKHVATPEHGSSKTKHGCDFIVLLDDNRYRCRCCDSTFTSRNLASDHINDTKHTTNAHLPCISIVSTDANQFRCNICNVDSDSLADVHKHIDTQSHASAKTKYGCDFISPKGNRYYCSCCNSTLMSRKLASDHTNETKHQRTANLTCICIIFTGGNEFYCGICRTRIDSSVALAYHQKNNEHLKNQKKYGCKAIAYRKNAYHCQCCEKTLHSRPRAFAHVQQKKHKCTFAITKRTKNSVNSGAQISDYSPYPYIVKLEKKNYYCAICDCTILGHSAIINYHLEKHDHTIGSQVFRDNHISYDEKSYRCDCCGCTVFGRSNVDQHIAGKNHVSNREEFVKSSNSNDKRKPQSLVMRNSSKNKTTNDMNIRTIKEEGGELSRPKIAFGGPKKINVFGSERGPIRCDFCGDWSEGAENYHFHLARHFCNDNIKDEENVETDDKEDSSSLELIEKNDVINTEAIVPSKSIGESVAMPIKTVASGSSMDKNDAKPKTFVRKETDIPMNINATIKHLDFNDNHIYTMNDKSADIALGFSLCVSNEKNVHCMVCQKTIDVTIKNYIEHLGVEDHCKNFESMITDAALFRDRPDEFSQLDLALEYMEEKLNGRVSCLACNCEIDDDDVKLRNHTNDPTHHRKTFVLHEKSKKTFENVKSMNCEWYDVDNYFCVPCNVKCATDVNFVKHLTSRDHAKLLKIKRENGGKLMFDFCGSCGLLWYGYRWTWSQHCNDSSHRWLARDGYRTSGKIPKSAESFLKNPADYMTRIVTYFNDAATSQRVEEAKMMRDLERAARTEFRRATAYVYGSRVTGLESPDSDIDVFLDCDNMYNGNNTSTERIVNYMTAVAECLNKEPKAWIVEQVLTTCRSPIIKIHHRDTGLSCDVSFSHGLAVENTRLIKYLIDICPTCREMIIILKQWLKLCELSGSERITNYALYWLVIFFLQTENILPSIADLIAMKNESRIVAGWEVGVSLGPTCKSKSKLTIDELLVRFFKFYANFDYRREVACPLLGKIVAKRDFVDYRNLPKEMGPYKSRVKNSREIFRIDSIMCIQDPYDLLHNLSKAVTKVHLNRFRKYCSNSAQLLQKY